MVNFKEEWAKLTLFYSEQPHIHLSLVSVVKKQAIVVNKRPNTTLCILLFHYIFSTTKRRKHADKVGKGLRHFSMKVCEKVRNKGFTSYNEVADELVLEFAAGMHGSSDSQVCYDYCYLSYHKYTFTNTN